MSLVRWAPFLDPFHEVEEFFGKWPSVSSPAMDMYETKDALIVEMPLAGVDAKDVSVSVKNGVLTVKGETKKEKEVEEKNYYRKEVRSGSFYREATLPTAVDEQKVSAEFDSGMLKITAPKAAAAEKQVSIKVVSKGEKK